jgi:arsenate reductase
MRYVLFVCTHNAGRSQIAQAFFERYAPADIRAESAGEEPAAAIWPNVIEAMREVGIDISDRRPKKLDLEMQLHADWAITLHCKASCPLRALASRGLGGRRSRRTAARARS